MKRKFLSALAVVMLAGPTLAAAAPDESQKQMMQRSMEAQRKLDAARSAQGARRDKLLQEHMDLMSQMRQQMRSARPGPNATAPQLREWIDEHLKLMDQMMGQMMDAERMMMMPMREGHMMMKSGK